MTATSDRPWEHQSPSSNRSVTNAQPFTGHDRGRRPRILVTTCALAAFQAAGAAAQDCRLEYAYAATPTSQNQAQADVTRGQTVTINRSDMLWLTNTRDRKLEVQVTMPTGGSKWVALEKGQRDPPILNYIGNTTLQNIKCHYLYESAVAMFTATWNGQASYQFTVAKQVKQEFGLTATQFMQQLQAHITPVTAGRLLREAYGYTPTQIVTTFKQRGYAVTATRDALAAATTQQERWALVTSPNGQDGAILVWLIGSYDRIDAALAMVGYSSTSGLATGMDPIVYMMKAAQYTPAQAARVIHQSSAGSAGAAAVADILYIGGYATTGQSYAMTEIAQGLAAEFSATPIQVAQWLGPLVDTQGLARVADALRAFSSNSAQITTWLVQAGFTVTAVVDGMARADVPASMGQIAAGLRATGVDVAAAMAPFEALRIANSTLFGGDLTHGGIARAMRDGGYPAGPLAVAMRQIYNVGSGVADSHKVASWLAAAGYSPRDCVDGMRAAYAGDTGAVLAQRLRHPTATGFINNMMGIDLLIRPEFAVEGLKSSFGASGAQVASWLADPWTPLEQALGIFEALTNSGSDVAAWMKSTRLPKQIGGSMKIVVTDDRAQLADHLRKASFQPVEATQAIRHMGMYSSGYDFSNSPETVALALRDGGYPLDAILEGITAEFPNVTRQQLGSWLSPSGRTSTQRSSLGTATTTTCATR